MKNKILYGLKLKGKEDLLKLEVEYNGDDRYACGEYKYKLTEDTSYQTYLIKNIEDIQYIINNKEMPTEWYNSELKDPVIPFDLEDLEIVKVTTSYEII